MSSVYNSLSHKGEKNRNYTLEFWAKNNSNHKAAEKLEKD